MPQEILVSAAASLTDAFEPIGAAFAKNNRGTTVRFNFAASGPLSQQILAGAPVDVFASASPREMDALAKAGKIEEATRVDFAGNRLVLIAPARARGGVKGWADLGSPAVRHVALSNPDSVPSGRYAVETLTRRGLWAAVRAKAVLGENVRQTLAYVAGGDADAGLVFATDARAEPRRARVVAVALPGTDHAPIRYPTAVIRDSGKAPVARRFVAFLRGRAAQQILARHGFAPAAVPPRASARG
jgi:molybdate transport system substrate-binding protein